MAEHELKVFPISDLQPRPNNARVHSKKQIRQIARSIERFGFRSPVLIDGQQQIIAGHGRVEAAKQLGIGEVPTISCEDMSESEVRAYAVADNRLTELAGWDNDQLALEFEALMDPTLDIDITVTGFEMPEVDVLLQSLVEDDDAEEDDEGNEIPVAVDSEPVSKIGDNWHLGDHVLMCGDARDEKTITSLLQDKRIDLVFADPPYNVPIARNVSGKGKIAHQDFALASGEMSSKDFTAFLKKVFANLAGVSVDGAVHFICIDWRHLLELLTAGKGVYSELLNLCIWAKTNGGLGSLYRSQYELVAVYKHVKAPHINNVQLGRFGRNRTNVWTYPGMSAFHEERDEALAMHPTVKPLALVKDALLDCSHLGGLVFDPFAGSGTTLLASEMTGRLAYCLELDPRYVDVAVRRFEQMTGQEAKHEKSGKSFSELKTIRCASDK